MLWHKEPVARILAMAVALCVFGVACEPPARFDPNAIPPDEQVAEPANETPADEPTNAIEPMEPEPAVRPEVEPDSPPDTEPEPEPEPVPPPDLEPEPQPEATEPEPPAETEPQDEPAAESPETEENAADPADTAPNGASAEEPAAEEPDAEDAVLRPPTSPAEGATDQLASLSQSFREVARVVNPSVVQVAVEVRPTTKRLQARSRISPSSMEEMLRRFGPLLEQNPELRQFFQERRSQQQAPNYERYNVPLPIGNASGWVYDDQGHVITSHHVVAQAGQITLTFHDDTEAQAKLVGSDPPTDIAVLKVERPGLRPPRLAEDDAQQGDIVLAIGSPFRYAFSVSQGIVSATGRQVGILGPQGYENFIQTDAAVNPGNSGGPLINARGEIIGMCTAIASRSGAFAGLGFATPVAMIREVADELIRNGNVERGYLGAVISDDPRLLATFGVERGVLIEDLVEGGPAQQAGLQPGDVVAAIDDEEVFSAEALRYQIAQTEPGRTIEVTLFRDGEWGKLDVTLEEQPVEDAQAGPAEETPEPAEPGGTDEVEALGKLGFQRLLTLTTEIAQENNLQQERGVLVLDVRRFSAAAIAGLRRGMVIVQAGGQEVASVEELRAAVEGRNLNEGIRMRVQMPGGPARFVLLSLGE